jgi:UPF0716 protein FxsA
MFRLFLLFTVIPLLELMLLIYIGQVIGFWQTLAIVILTGMVGAALARWQGWLALERVQREMQQGKLPAGAMFDGMLILVAGLLLITPGVITDLAGLCLLVPPIRAFVQRLIRHWAAEHVHVATTIYQNSDGPRRPTDDRGVDAEVIDTRVVDEN